MQIQHLVLFHLIVFLLAGPPLAFFLGNDGFYFNYLVRDRDSEYLIRSYLWVWYAVIVLAALYWRKMRKLLSIYFAKPFRRQSHRSYFRMWVCSMLIVLCLGAVLFVQAGFSHPLVGTKGITSMDLALKRASITESINMNVFNIGLHVFVGFALTLAIFFLNRRILSVLSVSVFVLFATFSMQKSAIASVIFQLIFVYLLLHRRSWKPIFYAAAGVGILGVFTAFAAQAENASVVFQALTARLFLGEFASLPSYFEIFERETLNLWGLLPPYIQGVASVHEPPASRVVIEYMFGESDSFDTLGVANSMFVGTAYAHMGIVGIIISPFIVFFNFYVVLKVFCMLKKNVITLFCLGYLLYRLTAAMNSSIAYFMVSGIQLLLIAVVMLDSVRGCVRRKSKEVFLR